MRLFINGTTIIHNITYKLTQGLKSEKSNVLKIPMVFKSIVPMHSPLKVREVCEKERERERERERCLYHKPDMSSIVG